MSFFRYVSFEPEIFLISGLKRAKCRFQARNEFQNGLEIDILLLFVDYKRIRSALLEGCVLVAEHFFGVDGFVEGIGGEIAESKGRFF